MCFLPLIQRGNSERPSTMPNYFGFYGMLECMKTLLFVAMGVAPVKVLGSGWYSDTRVGPRTAGFILSMS